jgi:hypothetical protein
MKMATLTSAHSLPAAITAFLADRWPILSTVLVSFFAAVLLQTVLKGNPVANIPVIGKEIGDEEKRRLAYLGGAKRLYAEGYQKVLFTS